MSKLKTYRVIFTDTRYMRIDLTARSAEAPSRKPNASICTAPRTMSVSSIGEVTPLPIPKPTRCNYDRTHDLHVSYSIPPNAQRGPALSFRSAS